MIKNPQKTEAGSLEEYCTYFLFREGGFMKSYFPSEGFEVP